MQTDTAAVAPVSVTAGLLDRRQLEADLKRGERTIIRYERAGMPVVKLGTHRLYDPAKVREWIIQHEQRPLTPTVGRPRKRAA